MLQPNLILDTDSYKASHWVSSEQTMYPPNTTGLYCYLTARKGWSANVLWFGLQHYLKHYLTQGIDARMIEEAAAFLPKHGLDFNEAGWRALLERYHGAIPLRIKSIPEGTVLPTKNILLSAESTDPEFPWLAGWFETQLVRLWYPLTVATQGWYIKKDIFEALDKSSDNPLAELPFKYHDFGSRGTTCREQAGIGGMAHLVNFEGSDTLEGIRYMNAMYGSVMSGFSISASEHSVVTTWGRGHEVEAYRNIVSKYLKPGKIVACVSDSYNIFNAVENFWGDELHEEVKSSGGTLVIRPDSGEPVQVLLKCLDILERKIGMTKNMKGFKVLPKYYRLIQGDGVNRDSIREILHAMLSRGYSASNIAFGCGGANLQKDMDRDTFGFAYKCSDAIVDGQHVRVFKDPVTDQGKKSLAGRLSLIRESGDFKTIEGERKDDHLVTTFENGKILKNYTIEEVRSNANKGLY